MRALPSGRLAVALIAALAAVAVVIAGVVLGNVGEPSATTEPVNKAKHVRPKYVALGSSFAAGTGVGERVGYCGQTKDNYPRRVAAHLNLTLVDVSCAGAVVSDIVQSPARSPERDPQIAAVTPDTSLVTITVGGNDLSYIGRLVNSVCANLAAGLYSPPLGRYCRSLVSPSAFPMVDRYQAVEQALTRTVQAVRERAPEARVLLVNYLPVVSVGEAPCPALPLEPWQVAETEAVGAQLAAATVRAAQATGAQVVDTEGLGAGHTACSPDPWIIGYGDPMPYHPNSAGKSALADAVVHALT